MSKIDQYLWTEKYRPHTVKDTILPSSLKNQFQKYVDTKNIPNLLLTGSPGLGKTTVARAMIEELGSTYHFINASMNGNIDTLRTDILQFASSVSSDGMRKYVILDEGDHLNCLNVDEEIILSNGNSISLRNMEFNKTYDVISLNIETKKFENDEAYLIKEVEKEVYRITMDDGSSIECTSDHPLMCMDVTGNIVERTINDGFDSYSVLMFK